METKEIARNPLPVAGLADFVRRACCVSGLLRCKEKLPSLLGLERPFHIGRTHFFLPSVPIMHRQEGQRQQLT